MFPLPLLPTVPDNLYNMPARHGLRYQNAFMKNALIRGFNVIHAVAPTINVGAHPAFHQFMEYVGMVCDMACLHLEGDEVFLKLLSDRGHPYRSSNNQNVAVVYRSLESLRQSVFGWDKAPSSYKSSCLLGAVAGVGTPLVDIFCNRVRDLSAKAMPKGITDQELGQMIVGQFNVLFLQRKVAKDKEDNIVWLGANSDISILLPFCTSHHDLNASKFWPPVTADAIKAMPELAQAHPNVWKFAPFDPVTRQGKVSMFVGI